MPAKKRAKPTVKRKAGVRPAERLNFSSLVAAIRRVHERSAAAASRAVNVNLTLRNWVIGWYIREYEQKGADRAAYGEVLIEKVAEGLAAGKCRELTARYLRQCRQFASVYPQIWQSLTAKSSPGDLGPEEPIRETGSPRFGAPTERLLNALSFTHFAELIAIDDPLKRQVATLYFERSGLSRKPEKLAAMVKAGAEKAEPRLAIRLAAIGNRLFVSKYQLQLPSKEDLQRFLEGKRREVGNGI